MLAREGAQIARTYTERRRVTPGFPFRWRQSLYKIVRAALGVMTSEHCSYCDGNQLDATGQETIDHFQPKGHPAFYELVCTWTNLFLSCTACNQAKREQWDDALLRPDVPDFAFERYFEYHFDTGELHPNPAATLDEQHRARRTIEILDLNRAGTCANRRHVVRLLRHPAVTEYMDGLGYRYLIPLCRAV